MHINLKKFLRHIATTIPMYEFISDLITFIRRPEIYDGQHEYVPLYKSGGNYIKSLILVGVITGLISFIAKGSVPVDNTSLILKPFAFLIILSYQAISFGMIIWALVFTFIFFKEKKLHTVCFLQTLHAYSVLNLLIPAFMFIGINRIILIVFSTLPFWMDITSLILPLIFFLMTYRLLVKPIQQYISRYYNNLSAWIITAFIFSLGFWLLGHLPSLYNNHVIDINNMNSLLNQLKDNFHN